jgi:hypothetical protein
LHLLGGRSHRSQGRREKQQEGVFHGAENELRQNENPAAGETAGRTGQSKDGERLAASRKRPGSKKLFKNRKLKRKRRFRKEIQ